MSDLTILKTDNLGTWIEPYITNKEGLETLIIPQTINSNLVNDSRNSILGVLPMDSLVRNLVNAGDLTFLAFNASAGTSLQSQVAGIQFSLHEISGQCINTLDIYRLQCQEIMKALIKIYKYLLAGKEELASIQLGYCAKIANQMGIYASDLGASFENLYNKSYDVSRNSLELRNLSDSEKNTLTKELHEFQALQKEAIEDRNQLLKDIDNLTAEHCSNLSQIQNSLGGFRSFVSGFLGFFGIRKDPRKKLIAQENARYSQHMQRLHQQRFEVLRNINIYTGRISSVNSSISDANRAVETFHIVYKALSTMVVALKEEALFWNSMKSYCDNLAKFKNLQPQPSLSSEKKIEIYSGKPFMNLYLRSLSQWMAIYGISSESLEAARIMEKQVSANIVASPSIENAKKLTPVLAQKLLGSINMQMEALESAKEMN